jgi:hypothetical protein
MKKTGRSVLLIHPSSLILHPFESLILHPFGEFFGRGCRLLCTNPQAAQLSYYGTPQDP